MSTPAVHARSGTSTSLTPPGSAPGSGHASPRSPVIKAKMEEIIANTLPPGDDFALTKKLKELLGAETEGGASVSDLSSVAGDLHAEMVEAGSSIGKISLVRKIKDLTNNPEAFAKSVKP